MTKYKLQKEDNKFFTEPILSEEEWLAVLHNSDNDKHRHQLNAVLMFFYQPDHRSTCTAIEKEYSISTRIVNMHVVNFGKYVKKVSGKEFFVEQYESSDEVFWPIVMLGKDLKNHFEWQLRPELVSALRHFLLEKLLSAYRGPILSEGLDNSRSEELYKWKLLSRTKGKSILDILNVMGTSSDNNILTWRTKESIRNVLKDKPNQLEDCFAVLLSPNCSFYDRFHQFVDRGKAFMSKADAERILKEKEACLFLACNNPEDNALYKWTLYKEACAYLGIDTKSSRPVDGYLAILNDIISLENQDPELIEKLKSETADYFWSELLNAQDVLYQMQDFMRNSRPKNLQHNENLNINDNNTDMEKYTNILKSNHNLILTGAPGTGKTFLAKEIAKAMGCDENEIDFVQFHPSYDYSDFVEGLRPVSDNQGNVAFERKDGVFKEFCKRALEQSDFVPSERPVQVLERTYVPQKATQSQAVSRSIPQDTSFESVYKSVENDIRNGNIRALSYRRSIVPVKYENRNIYFGETRPKPVNDRNLKLMYDYYRENGIWDLSPYDRDHFFKLISKLSNGYTNTIDYINFAAILQEMLNRARKLDLTGGDTLDFVEEPQEQFYDDTAETNSVFSDNQINDAIDLFKREMNGRTIQIPSVRSNRIIVVQVEYYQIKVKAASGKLYSVSLPRIEHYIKTKDYDDKHESWEPAIGQYILDHYLTPTNTKSDDIIELETIAAEAEMKDVQSLETQYYTNKPFVFIIDEINRGELSKIFGELFFAIDPGYRGTKGRVKTQYQNLVESGDPFEKGVYVPENVYIIGTMNDIDRGVESMDFAIRRRFAWVEVNVEGRMSMLDEIIPDWSEAAKRCMTSLNAALKEKAIGLTSAYDIGPAYFLKLEQYDGDFEKLWNYHIKGIVTEYLRGTRGVEEKVNVLKEAFDAYKQ